LAHMMFTTLRVLGAERVPSWRRGGWVPRVPADGGSHLALVNTSRRREPNGTSGVLTLVNVNDDSLMPRRAVPNGRTSHSSPPRGLVRGLQTKDLFVETAASVRYKDGGPWRTVMASLPASSHTHPRHSLVDKTEVSGPSRLFGVLLLLSFPRLADRGQASQ